MATAIETTPERKPRFAEGEAAPRIWIGMTLWGWLRLLVHNRFAFERRFWLPALALTFTSAFNTLWGWITLLTHGWRVARVKINKPPIFVLGHWRSGTTLLHELLACDPRFAYPTTYACLAPTHFLRTEWVARRWFNFMIPDRRPMDNMPAGLQRPQEDEFALCNLGLPSPYLSIAFPNRPPLDAEYLTFDGVPARERRRWQRKLTWFLRQLTYRDRRRIVLKSPTHTGRVRVLLEMFPEARFVHIVRDPLVVFPSTVKLWKSLAKRDAMQTPTHAELEERVLTTFERMYEAFERDRPLIPPGHICDVRYEDLVADPVAVMRRVYDELGLSEFEHALPAIKAYLAAADGYQTNQFELSSEQEAEISRRWQGFAERYGYESDGDAEH